MSLTKHLWVALGLALGLIAQPDMGHAQDCTTKIGAVLPTSVDWGRPIAETAQFAVDQVNAAGGVNGCQIEMVLRDTQVDPKVGVDAAKALVDLEGVKLLLGAVSSGVSMPILTSVTVPSGVMQMSCCSSSTAFTKLAEEGKTNGLWFRTFATTGVQSAVAAKVARDQGFKSIAVLYKNDDWGQDMARLIAADFAAVGVEVTACVFMVASPVEIHDLHDGFIGEVAVAEGTHAAHNPVGADLVVVVDEDVSYVRLEEVVDVLDTRMEGTTCGDPLLPELADLGALLLEVL